MILRRKRTTKERFSQWTRTQPTFEQTLEHFCRYIHLHTNNAVRDFNLTHEDGEDIYHDVVCSLLRKIKPNYYSRSSYVMFAIRCAVVDALKAITGKRSDPKSQRQRTVHIDGRASDDPIAAEIMRITSTSPDYETVFALRTAREMLSATAQEIFDWVLQERESTSTVGLLKHCKDRYGYGPQTVAWIQQEIVDAMHACGLSLN
jgi:DNA-directed RNA polymerase specialized sigma24 family protein